MIPAQPSAPYEAVFYGFPSGLVGTCGFHVEDGQGVIVTARQTSGIIESPAGSGVYNCTGTAPAAFGQYVLIFDNGAVPLTPSDYAVEDLEVIAFSPVTDAYAAQDDVLLRAGRIGAAFSVAGKRPNLADLDRLIGDTGAEINQAIRARGYDPAILDQHSKDALRDLNAYGALYRALTAIDDPSDAIEKRIDEARAIWEGAMGNRTGTKEGSIARGTFPAIAALEAGRGGGGPVTSAGDFWDDEPSYGTPEAQRAEEIALRGTTLGPYVQRGQKL